jgi:hypothetical protein
MYQLVVSAIMIVIAKVFFVRNLLVLECLIKASLAAVLCVNAHQIVLI